MVDRLHVENFLRLNGIPPTAPDEEIKSALMTAKWRDQDVEVALLALRGEKRGDDVELLAARQLLHSDEKISPQMLSSLLGVRVDVNEEHITSTYSKDDESKVVLWQYILLGILSIIFAFLIALGTMFVFNVGPFYSPFT